MKIIQLITAQYGDTSYIERTIYGLGDNGALYKWRTAMSAYVTDIKYHNIIPNLNNFPRPEDLRYHDGWTSGWVLIGEPGYISKKLPHASDPTRHERS